MLDSLKKFSGELGVKPAARFEDNDYRLAAAAMLIHVMSVDGDTRRRSVTRSARCSNARFELDDAAPDELIEAATAAEHEAVDLYQFTSLLNRTLDEDGRLRIVEMMWQVVYADGRVNEFEDNLIWRAADLLGISSARTHRAAPSRCRPSGDAR